MSDSEIRFESSKGAAAYALSQRRGPGMRRPSYGHGPKGWRSSWDGCGVRACMQRAGILPDSPEEKELDDWVRGRGPKPIETERRFRRELSKAGMLDEDPKVIPIGEYVIKEWQDPDTGVTTESLAYEPRLKPAREGDD